MWHFELLLSSHVVHDNVKRLIALVASLLSNAEFLRRLDALAHIADLYNSGTPSRSAFKEGTRRGAVWLDGWWKDLGNYFYAHIYLLIVYTIQDSATFRPTFQKLMNTWETLSPNPVAYTDETMSMQGDFIEFILDETMCTGPTIAPLLRRERLDLQRLMRELSQAAVSIERPLFDTFWGGCPTLRHRPPVREYTVIFICSVQLKDPTFPEENRHWLRAKFATLVAEHRGSFN